MLDANIKEDFSNILTAGFDTVVDEASLITILDNFWTDNIKLGIYKELLQYYKGTRLSQADRITAIAVTVGGTGYSVGDKVTIIGDGYGASAIVSTVNAGVVTGIKVLNGGYGYSTATISLVSIGNGDATATATVDVGIGIVDAYIATI